MLEILPEVESRKKHDAVSQVLASAGFARSEQLRTLLRYLCELEIAGRGAELSEYQIGVNALGRPANFAPHEDAMVRNRAHALRRKLKEVYEQELHDAPIRIELPKGSYQPRFLPRLPDLEPPTPPAEPPRRRLIWLAIPAGLLVLIGAFEAGVAHGKRETVNPLFETFWGPLLTRDANTGVCVTAPWHLVPREYAGDSPPERTFAPTEPIRQWYREQTPGSSGLGLRLLPTHGAPRYGEGMAALTVAQFLANAHASMEILSDNVVKLPALRRRNAILFGSPEYSDLVGGLLASTPFTVVYDPARQENKIVSRKESAQVYGARHMTEPNVFEQYGLITSLPSGEGNRRTLVFTGTSSASTQGAAEYFTSPSGLEELSRKLPRPLPAGYQIVVKVKVSISTPISQSYEAYQPVL